MKQITWKKVVGKGKEAVCIGNLAINVPTPEELVSLPQVAPGWCLLVCWQLMCSHAKVKAASYFVSCLKHMSRSEAESKLLTWTPTSKAPEGDGVNIALRAAARNAIKGMVATGLSVDQIRKALVMAFETAVLESALIAEGLVAEPEAEEETAE